MARAYPWRDALGLATAIVVTLLTEPMYRTSVVLEVNPPTVEILDERTRGTSSSTSTWDFVATQVGLLSSRTLPSASHKTSILLPGTILSVPE